MKKKILLSVLLAGGLLMAAMPGKAQVHVQINVGLQPVWGPVGYDYAEYYYMPDIDVYFSIPRREYIFFSGGRWVSSPYLPDRCRGYDLYGGYKVVINARSPWLHNQYYRERYQRYRGYYGRQELLRDYRGPERGYYDRDQYERRRYEGHEERSNEAYGYGYDHRRGNGNGRGRGNGQGWENGHGRGRGHH